MDLVDITQRDLFGWFVERILEARKEREKRDVLFEEDPAATIYLASLLAHMAEAPWLSRVDRQGERLDMDVAEKTSKMNSPRERLEGYRCAADRYLLHLGLWDGLQGRQVGRYYQITEHNLADRASAYYGFAAHLAERMPPPVSRTAGIFAEFARNLRTYLGILLSMRGDILHLLPVLTPGEEFHLLGGAGGPRGAVA